MGNSNSKVKHFSFWRYFSFVILVLLNPLFLNNLCAETNKNDETNLTFYCAVISDSSVKDCINNDIFVEAAEKCLKKITDDSKNVAEKSKLFSDSLLRKSDVEGKNSENGLIQAESKILKFNKSENDLLIAKLNVALKELDIYRESLFPPDGYDDFPVENGAQGKYMMSQDCYGESLRSLNSIKKDLIEKLNSLLTTGEIYKNNSKTADEFSGSLNSKNVSVKQNSATGKSDDIKANNRKESDVTKSTPSPGKSK